MGGHSIGRLSAIVVSVCLFIAVLILNTLAGPGLRKLKKENNNNNNNYKHRETCLRLRLKKQCMTTHTVLFLFSTLFEWHWRHIR